MRGVIIGTVIACIALIGAAVFFTVNGHSSGPRIIPIDSSYTQRVTDGYWKRGASNPKVTLTEYLDFQCPSCLAAAPIVDDAMSQLSDIVQLQVRLYPITSIHANALQAAKAAEAAGRQGKFWSMHDLLFTNQQTWEVQSPSQFKTTLDGFAQNLKLNMDQFHNDEGDSTITDTIDRDQAAANRIPITGTPTFLINGQLLKNFPATADQLIQLLKDAAAQAPAQ